MADTLDYCALNGLMQVANIKCEYAKFLADSGKINEAKKIYNNLLTQYSNLPCAVEGLKKLPTEYDKVKALVKVGKYDEAWKKLENAIAVNPDDTQLNKLSKQSWARQKNFKSTIEWLKYYAITFIVAIVLISLIILIIFWI